MSKALIIVISITIQIIINIIFVIYRHKTNKQEDSVGKIIINQSDPDKEYFECQLYSKEFFKEVCQKSRVTFDVEVK